MFSSEDATSYIGQKTTKKFVAENIFLDILNHFHLAPIINFKWDMQVRVNTNLQKF